MGLEMPDQGEITNGDLNYNKLIDYIDDGIIHIPDFQREFVWDEQKILDLLDSIYYNYPIGSLIFWVTKEDFAYSAPIGDKEGSSSIYKSRFFVIDGQQRIKSLYHAAKNKELEMESGTKQIDVQFDLEQERFTLQQDIRKRDKSMYPIPGIKNEELFFLLLEAVTRSTVPEYQEEHELSDNSLEKFLWSLATLGFITEVEEGYELTKTGEQILKHRDNELAAGILVDHVKFVKDALEMISDNPSITRKEAVPDFQSVYGGSENTAYQQFGRRCRWLRALQLVKKEGRGYHINESGRNVLKDIRETEQEIESQFVPLNNILVDQADIDYDYLSKFPEEKRDKINKLRQVFSDYKFSIILVNKTDWEEVCDIFERINTQGQHLTVVDLMIAKTWSGEEFNLREELERFKEEIGEDIPDITILQAVSLNVSRQCRRQDILGLQSGVVKNNWEEIIESLRKSVDFLKNNLNLSSLNLIPYPAQLVPLSRFFFEMGNNEPTKSQNEKLLRWFWKSGISNRFDSAVATKLEEDGRSMENIVNGQPTEFKYSYVQRSVEDIINQKYSLRNAFVKSITCLLASQKPLNPVNNAPVSHDNFSRFTQSEMHHIFPKNYLRKQDIDQDLINSVSNILFLPANINRDPRFKEAPGVYLSQIDNPKMEDALKTHLIPNLDESGLMEDDFNRFLNYRACQILNKLEEVTGEENILTKERELSPETPFTNEMHIRELIRGTDSYVHWFDKYFTRKGLEFLTQEINPEKVQEIKILTGTARTDHRLRSDFKKFREEMEKKGVKVEMRVLSGETADEIHDRWLLAENYAYNIPSINTIGRNQYTDITETTKRPPFRNWWEEGDNILEDWNQIQKVIN